jgi:hypothetical protein
MYSFFALLLLLFLLVAMHNDIRGIEKNFQGLRLSAAVDYATEAAFQSSLEGGNIGISYQDLQTIKVNPANVLATFKNLFMLSYDMAFSKENFESLDSYISTAVLAVDNGYYIATLTEIDTAKTTEKGGEYQLKWGMKKPYTVDYGSNGVVAYSLGSQSWIHVNQNSLPAKSGATYTELCNTYFVCTNEEDVISSINNRITEDINYNINLRNQAYTKGEAGDFIYLPSSKSGSGVNPLTKPSLIVSVQGIDFAGSQILNAKSVGGFTIAKKIRVLAFLETTGGVTYKYYCFESQMPTAKLGSVVNFYNTVDEAALDGYKPHSDYLRNPLSQ